MIYALIVAIDDYPIASHKLNGCVNDANSVIAYLEGNYACDDLKIKTLFDQEATKANVIQGFEHFKQADTDDTCLLYYCGHGSQVPSPPEFHHIDPDGKLETLVCWDSRIEAGGYDLMDKELSYLIWDATHEKNQHFVAIFDCCHSGTNTRDVRVTSRMAETARNIPSADNFHGQERYQKGTAQAGRVDLTPPSGRHIALAAASATETAKELRIGDRTHGAFTYNLISLLEQYNGQISYSQLISNLKVQVKNYVEKQSPQIDASENEDKQRLFLGKAPQHRAPTYTVNYDKKAGHWTINAGAMHNWPTDRAAEIELEIAVDGKSIAPKIKKVGSMKSVLADDAALDKTKSYLATLKKIPATLLKLAFAPDSNATVEKLIRQAAKDHPPLYYQLIDDPEQADYWVRAIDDTIRLTFPGEYRPVFRRLHGYNQDNAVIFLGDVNSVAHWHHVKNISNPRTTLKRDEYDIELLRIDQPGAWDGDDDCAASRVDWREEVVFNYDYDGSKEEESEKWLQPAFRMKVKNTSNRRLYFSTVNMQADYAIQNKFMAVQELGPNEEAWLLDRVDNGDTYKCIPLNVDDAFLAHGINEVTDYMKVFVSTQELSTDDFNQEALEMDDPTNKTTRAGRKAANHPPRHDWTVEDIVLKTVRPTREVVMKGGEQKRVANAVTIEMPAGVSGMVMLNSKEEATRNLSASTPLPEFPSGWDNHDLAEGLSQKPPVNILEFYASEGSDQVTADNPIKVTLEQTPGKGEFVVPVGFDPETGLYFPVGMMDEDGTVLIEDLPEPTTSGTRSLGGSIKIFFQKAVGKYLPFVYQHPQLATGVLQQAEEENAAAGLKLEYNTDAEAVKNAVAEADRIVMYIHGIIGDTREMPKSLRLVKDATGHKLEDNYDLLLTFDYENLNTPIEETAQLLKERLEAAGLVADHGKTFHIVAHSMGGLVSRWFIEKLEGNKVVNHLYQLGTPNQGSPYGSLYEMATPLLANAVNGAAFVQPYVIPLRFVGKFLDKLFFTLKQMNPGSDFFKALNDSSDPGIPYTIIAGNTKLIPPAVAEPQAKLLKKIMTRFKSRGHYTALDLLLFKQANDIAVSTEFITNIPGAENRQFPPVVRECACDHISYFGNPAGLDSMAALMLEEG